jgi:hypothetical protein
VNEPSSLFRPKLRQEKAKNGGQQNRPDTLVVFPCPHLFASHVFAFSVLQLQRGEFGDYLVEVAPDVDRNVARVLSSTGEGPKLRQSPFVVTTKLATRSRRDFHPEGG